jgi:uncharacterized membrane protein YhfC
MVNPMLLLSGIGMVLVGILVPLYWKRKTQVKLNYFLWGAGIWVIAIAVKIAMDYTITQPLSASLEPYGLLTVLLVMGLYVGLRTGILESGFSYLAILKTRLRGMNYREGIAFGIGFGSIEALFLGITSFLNILMFVMFPDIISLLPEAVQAMILSQLSASSWIVFGPIIERILVMFIHVFSTLLVLYAVKKKAMGYLVLSILFKTLVDGIIPWLVYSLEPVTELPNAYIIEIPFIILAIIAYFGIKWMEPKFRTGLKKGATDLIKKVVE